MRLKESDYQIDKTKDGYRVRLIRDDSHHTHLKSKNGAINAVKYVTQGKIPKRVSNWYLVSLQRISLDDKYIERIQELLDTRNQKGRKQMYYNAKKKN